RVFAGFASVRLIRVLASFPSRCRPPPSSTLFPYTTLFRSHLGVPERRARVLQGEQLAGLGRVAVAELVRVPAVRHSYATKARKLDLKSTRLNSSHRTISYAVFCLKKKKNNNPPHTKQQPPH